jgi:hypothetical protein
MDAHFNDLAQGIRDPGIVNGNDAEVGEAGFGQIAVYSGIWIVIS